MPTYDYRCPKGHEFEKFQRMSDEPEATCPECGADAERMISGGAGFLFKGEGFYITDYRSEEYKKKASSEKGKAKGSGGSNGADKGSSESSGGDSSAKAGSASGTGSESGSSRSGSGGTSKEGGSSSSASDA